MATYLKRTSKLFVPHQHQVNNNSSNSSSSGSSVTAVASTTTSTRASTRSSTLQQQQPELKLRELICPVCRTILREPVTLPCSHNLCLRCLRGTVEQNSLSCPLCRQRVGSWLRAATKTESLVNHGLWELIKKRFPEELELANATASSSSSLSNAACCSASAGDDISRGCGIVDIDLDPEIVPKRKVSAAGEIRKEYELQVKRTEEDMRRKQEKERLASEASIKKIQEDEEKKKMLQLAQDQIFARELARQEAATNGRHDRSSRLVTLANSKAKTDNGKSKSTQNQKSAFKSKDMVEIKKQQNVAFISKVRSERYSTTAQSSSSKMQKDSSDVFLQKLVPIQNAVTRVVRHQSRVNQSNNLSYSAALGELMNANSKIFGLQSKEELHVPNDVISSKKKKLGVEVCVTVDEGEERIGSAESAGSHDSINQEIHHFKPIKALPRTALRTTSDGKQVDPKLIRVLPILKRVSNAVPKSPTPTLSKKMFGCSWSAFKRISQQVLKKDLPTAQQETKKTEKKLEQPPTNSSKSSKLAQELEERSNTDLAFDSNENYTKNVNKIINGTKVSKRLNLNDQTELVKPNKRVKTEKGKVKNGLVPGKHKTNNNKKTIEVVNIDESDQDSAADVKTIRTQTPDPLACTSKDDFKIPSPELEPLMENIAERIKKRNTKRVDSNLENVQSAINVVTPAQKTTKGKSKKVTPKKVRKTKLKNPAVQKVKVPVTTTITSQIKRLAARSLKRPRYTEDSESEVEPERPPIKEKVKEVVEKEKTQVKVEESKIEPKQESETEKSDPITSPSEALPASSPPKKPRKNPKPSKRPRKLEVERPPSPSPVIDEEAIMREQERLEQQAAQEQKDRELALQLQARFDAMQRIAGRTRRGGANRLPSPMLVDDLQRRQKRVAVD